MNIEIRYAQIKDSKGKPQRVYFLATAGHGRMRSLSPAEYGQLLQLSIKGWRKSWFRRLWAFLFHRGKAR